MKINISKTEYYAMPHAAWNRFVEFISKNDNGNESKYTPMQKMAALCLWYKAEVNVGGHLRYFDKRKNVDKDELLQALQAIGAPEFADNFIEAVKYGREDDYVKADTWFRENETALFITIEKYLLDNVSEFYEIVDEDLQCASISPYFG